MKVRIEPDGTVELELDDPSQTADALKIVAQLRGEEQGGEVTNLNTAQYELWSWMVENDTPSGIHLSAIARHVGCTNGAANQRAITLMKLGAAERVRQGYYRARQ